MYNTCVKTKIGKEKKISKLKRMENCELLEIKRKNSVNDSQA